ncbi:hypothetical protein ASE66_12480 [Bosea sp. Root483D1]|uniref:hypothetical protein n=1 Tax=Bosea sp. Root483D1 TaxID=1736544 RepID=UPI00070AA0D5|nr:hypothetical protein [Bosea sp. Root483D1]KRE15655.1 hypothetical protein ASE66_12480 [Bosea sp. Root483D1]
MAEIRAALQEMQVERKTAGGAGAPAGVSGKRAGTVLVDEIAAAEQRGYARGLAEGKNAGWTEGYRTAWGGIAEQASEALGRGSWIEPSKAPVAVAKAAAQPKPKIEPNRQPSEPNPLNSAAKKMLAVLDTNLPVARSWTQVATLAGLKARGGHFNAGRKGLADGGLITEADGLVRLAQPSDDAAMASNDPAAVVDMWASALSGAAPKILRRLFETGGAAERTAIAADLGMKPQGGHWNAGWKELRDNHVVRIEGQRATLTELPSPGAQHDRGDR